MIERRGPMLVALLMTVVAAACGSGSEAEGDEGPAPIRVAAASDLKFALDEIINLYADEGGDPVDVTYGSSGTFFSQLQNEAPFDLYLSADLSYPQTLEDDGIALSGSVFEYAEGRIVIWVPDDSPIDVEAKGFDSLTDDDADTIAIANPEHAPYGRAAVAALDDVDMLDEVEDRFVLGENIAQTAQFVDTGAADIGIIALSLALAPDAAGRYWEIPAKHHPPIDQGGAIMRWARDPQAAQAFVSFLTGPTGTAVLTRYGFDVPES